MKKQVFLFELDSVRKTDDEIIVGQKTLYDEIVRNGNIVVLTYNDELQRTYIELTTYDSSVLEGKYNGSMYQLDLDSWSEMKIIK